MDERNNEIIIKELRGEIEALKLENRLLIHELIEGKYENLGIKDFRLQTVEQITLIYGPPLDIEGYDNLSEMAKKLYQDFIVNFYNSWGLKARVNIQPLSISVSREHDKQYLKFEYSRNGEASWLHVTNATEWA